MQSTKRLSLYLRVLVYYGSLTDALKTIGKLEIVDSLGTENWVLILPCNSACRVLDWLLRQSEPGVGICKVRVIKCRSLSVVSCK